MYYLEAAGGPSNQKTKKRLNGSFKMVRMPQPRSLTQTGVLGPFKGPFQIKHFNGFMAG